MAENKTAASAKPDAAKAGAPKFEECLARLEGIVEELEKGDIPLERAIALFEEGVKLSNSCRGELETAEGKVEILMKKGGKLQAQPFEPLAPEDK